MIQVIFQIRVKIGIEMLKVLIMNKLIKKVPINHIHFLKVLIMNKKKCRVPLGSMARCRLFRSLVAIYLKTDIKLPNSINQDIVLKFMKGMI